MRGSLVLPYGTWYLIPVVGVICQLHDHTEGRCHFLLGYLLRETILNEAAFELQYLNQYDFI